MKPILKSLSLAAIALVATQTVHAEEFDAKLIPAESKWLVHVDADGLQKTDTWKHINARISTMPGIQQKIGQFEKMIDIKVPDDIHDVSIFGTDFGGENAGVIIHSNAKAERLKTLVSLNETSAINVIGGQTIYSWDDKGKQTFGGFSGESRVVISQNRDLVIAALDVLSGKLEGMKADSSLAHGKGAGAFLYIAGDGLADLPVAKEIPAHIVKKITAGWVSLGEANNQLTVHTELSAADPETAKQIRSSVDGLVAMVNLGLANQENPNEQDKMVLDLLSHISTSLQGNNVQVDWSISTETAGKIIDEGIGGRWKPKGKEEPASRRL